MKELSVVVPVYGSPQTLKELVERLFGVLDAHLDHYEIILVNDACPKGSWDVVQTLVGEHENLIGINFSRNFGQHYAITAGLEQATGDDIVVMDCDLQDRPEEIPRLLEKRREGFEVVLARRAERKDSRVKRLSSYLFHTILGYLTDSQSDESVANFGIYSRKAIEQYLRISERARSFPLHIRWLGFSTATVDCEHAPRAYGRSSYTLSKLLNLALDLIVSFSDKPMMLMIQFGFATSFFSVFVALFYLAKWVFFGISVEGWTSIMVSIWFLGGIMILMIGIVGLYIAKTFDETKRRPLFIIDEVIGNQPSKH